jgi:hypothetical protein
MHARLVTGRVPPGRLGELIELWRTTVPESARQQKGFQGARLMLDRESGELASLGLWSTEDDARASVQWNDEQLARFTAFFVERPVAAIYEVVAEG